MQAIRKPYPNNPRQAKVYQKALKFMDEIYDVVEGFPAFEKYGMCDQMRRAVSAIVANIAEGRQSIYYTKEFSQLDIALGSTAEVRAFLDMGLLRNYLTTEQHQQLDDVAEEIVKMLIGLMGWVEKQLKGAGEK